MTHPIANAPCSWGVDDPKNPDLPAWATVLKEAAQAGYRSIELGPWGYLPTDPASLRAALEQHQLSLVAGTIFDDLVSEAHFPTLVALTHQIIWSLAAAEGVAQQGQQRPISGKAVVASLADLVAERAETTTTRPLPAPERMAESTC